MKNHQRLAAVAVVALLLSTAAWVGGGTSGAVSDLSTLRVHLPPCTASCIDYDEECSTPSWDLHNYSAWDGDNWFSIGGSHCRVGACEGEHTECGIGEEDLDAIELAVARLDGPGLRRLVDRNHDVLVWNQERRSLQLIGCGGRVALSLLVNEEQESSLGDS